CSFFLFSSRRRHTRFSRDWSSDVCSSDLRAWRASAAAMLTVPLAACGLLPEDDPTEGGLSILGTATPSPTPPPETPVPTDGPSTDRKSVVEGKWVALGGARTLEKGGME